MHSESKKADFIAFRSLNWSIKRISEKIGVCPRTLADWNSQYANAISNLRYLNADVHFQNLVEARQKDIETLTARQQALDTELAARDLVDIPTDKLVRLTILSREELLQARDHAATLVRKGSYIPDPVPWYLWGKGDNSSKTESEVKVDAQPKIEAPDSTQTPPTLNIEAEKPEDACRNAAPPLQ